MTNYFNSHEKASEFLASELFGLSPEIKKKIFVFQENETYNLRKGNHLARKNIRKTQYEKEKNT